ncbi:GNAT family N-acetyltransferase [Octadecabacter sp.]|jgi:predicted N-acyltransferase|nr:GNAT family N-acetyltransferase [Octadecabacter sp.]MDC0013026.1 GNAT family N-acetyltransferase [Octadecabacter sp.]MDC1216062.1 GNAT family N-acetyltransferase [Octadecabacter sp.]MDC1231270.1 GNAT family N-acetyltransferase [Octadecabacter sp.]MDC1381147.1 GNAT family N-acetyltransferase [Octadecabacter sp.]|tara:strand:+ start:2725 stop:3909 length:1185 start_codon:yes stop_codon:yes gene_type:complete
MDSATIEITTHLSIAAIDPADWDACACPEAADRRAIDPFTTHRFLKALEDSGSVGAGTGWDPHYLAARQDGQLIAVAPLYGKNHSQGEYMFDHNFAQAYERSGGRYYPKLQIAVPFTPATGRRFLTRAGFEVQGMSALVQGAVQIASDNELSSIHATFCTEGEALAGAEMGLLHRTSQQYHWANDGYADWDAFLAALSSRKRKTLRKERHTAQDFGGDIVQLTGDQIEPHHWDAFWDFYQDTGARKWGQPYLTRKFFDIAQKTLRDDMLLVFAMRDGVPIAGALNFIGRDTLYGRYWGCSENLPCLHFEICYYQAIDYALAHDMKFVEAGAQGEHKLARGYLPVTTHSLHWFGNAGFRDAVADYLEAERKAVDEEIEVLTSYGPFKKIHVEEQE